MRPLLALATTLALALVLAAPPAAHAQKKNPEGVPVLILSGGQREHHGYRDQAFALARALEDTGRYRVTIAEDAAVLEVPTITNYRVIVLTADRRDPEFKLTEAQRRRLVELVHDEGIGFVSLHAADNAAPDWSAEMRTMFGGVFSHDTSGGRPDGKVRKGSYRVTIRKPDHPIARGVADFDLADELYYQMQIEPGVDPIATVDFEGTAWPVAWAHTFGRGRVFHWVLGHRDFGPDKADPLGDANALRLVAQGIDWVAGSAP